MEKSTRFPMGKYLGSNFLSSPSYLGSQVGAGQIVQEENRIHYGVFYLRSPWVVPPKILFLDRQDLGFYHAEPSGTPPVLTFIL